MKNPPPIDAPRATCDAVLWELRNYGIAQLAKDNCRRRLPDLSTKHRRFDAAAAAILDHQ
jgi:hypothetical protein